MSDKTNTNEIVVIIDNDTRDIIQRHWLDYIQRNNVIKGLIEDHKFDKDTSIVDSDIFKVYEKRAQESYVQYEAAGNIMIKQYEPEEVKGKNYNWSLDFESKKLKFTLV